MEHVDGVDQLGSKVQSDIRSKGSSNPSLY